MAERKAYLDQLGQVAEAGMGGLISGAGMDAGKVGLDYVGQQARTQVQKTASTGEAGSTVIDTDPAGHTPEQQETIRKYQAATDSGILAFVERWRGLKDQNYRKKVRMDIAPIDQRTVQDVKVAVGVDISDFTGHSLSGNALGHIDRRHGAKGEADHSMADLNDIARMGYVLEHYDSVEALLDREGKPVLSTEHRNADGSHAPVVRFQKRVDGTYYVVEAVPDSSAKELRVISAYMNKANGSTDQVLDMPQSSGPQPTSETPVGAYASVPKSTIHQDGPRVNPESGGGQSVGAAQNPFIAVLRRGVEAAADTGVAVDTPVPGPGLNGEKSGFTQGEVSPLLKPLIDARKTMDLQSVEEGATIDETEPAHLDEQEEHAVLSYKSSESYPLNEALRDGTKLTPVQQRIVEGMDRALPKFPVYQGTVYRRIGFDFEGEEALEAFLDEHQPGRTVQYPAFTSASIQVDGYPVEGKLTVTFIIQSKSGRNMAGHGNNFESEIVFPRQSRFLIERTEMGADGKPVIYMKEVGAHGGTDTGGETLGGRDGAGLP